MASPSIPAGGEPPAPIDTPPGAAHPEPRLRIPPHLRALLLPAPPRTFGKLLRAVFLWIVALTVALWLFFAFLLVLFRFVDPPTTALHIERRIQSLTGSLPGSKPYRPRYDFIPLSQISPNLQHAVVAAEDARFYQHHGFDWQQIQLAVDEDREGHRLRGASTIDQQLIKNLFFGTSRSFLRKGAEASLVPVAEVVLGKRRILELYLNVVEWGPGGIYGADAACRYHYGISARAIGRDQAARLAAILPNPIRRRPQRMDHYSSIILTRMSQMGW
ncbi:MAG TPA: monofunctional biosynthetic peptidoglycan transglycosylase [Terracidiphilus sp.]|nr:monofunctional biosynthetic peptidoglycan transglycosylase [Terracidiphilus sp.]